MELPDWLRGIVLIGNDGSDYRIVRVDDSGALYALMKGEYNGVLTTVALDSEGRLSAFVIDSVDAWDRMLSIGLAEHASRLGSIVRYDRRGTVCDILDFANGYGGPYIKDNDSGCSISLSATVSRSGMYSALLSLANVSGHYARLVWYRGWVPDARVGVEACFCAENEYCYLDIELAVDTGSAVHVSYIRYRYDDNSVLYYDSAGNFVALPAIAVIPNGDNLWSNIKFVIDTATGKYVRLMLNNKQYDLSALSCFTDVTTGQRYVAFGVKAYSAGGGTSGVYIDDIILTSNEPAN